MNQCVALLLAGGFGSRLGSQIPKQYLEVSGKPVIAYCLETLAGHPEITGIWVVAQEPWRDVVRQWAGEKLCGFSEPGGTRQLSIWNGMEDIRKAFPKESEDMTLLIHDAVRPLVTAETISACIEGCLAHAGVMPALPVKDTVYYGQNGRIEALLDRSKVIAGQAPEAFRFKAYYEANKRLMPDEILKINGSTEPAVLAGLDVQYIPGDERNFKITTQADLERFEEIIRAKR